MSRSPRINARGMVRCCACNQWLSPDSFAYPPSFNGRPYPYCRPCNREIDRIRWRGERRETNNISRLVRQRRDQQAERRERLTTVQNAILVIRKRGFTKADICRMADVSFTSVTKWERGEQTPTHQVVGRMMALLRETTMYPTRADPVYRRRLPHPDIDFITERMQSKIVALPVRSRWKEQA